MIKMFRLNFSLLIEFLSGYLYLFWFVFFQGFDWEGLNSRTLTPPIVPKVQGAADTSNFDKYPRDEAVPADELSGWDKDF